MIDFLILVVFLFLAISSWIKSKHLLNPISLVGGMWLILLFFSTKGIGGLYTPHLSTILLGVTVAIFIAFGAMFSLAPPPSSDIILEKNLTILNALFILLCVVPVAIAFSNFLITVLTKGYYYYLYTTRIESVDRSLSAGGAFNSTILAKVTRPIIYFYTFTAISYLVLKGNRRLILNSLITLLLISIIFTSRADSLVLIIPILFLFPLLVRDNYFKNKAFYKKIKRMFLLLAFIIISVFIWISLSRAGEKSLYETFIHYVLNYHTVGFILFDIAYNDTTSFIHEMTGYGLITFSSLGFVFQQIFNFLGIDFVSPAITFRSEVGVPVDVGRLLNGSKDYELNAFYTFMGPVYTDFGEIGIFIISFFYGFFLMRCYLGFIKYRDVYNLSLLLFLMWTGYNSLLQSALSTDYWWFILVFIFVFNKVKLLSFKMRLRSSNV